MEEIPLLQPASMSLIGVGLELSTPRRKLTAPSRPAGGFAALIVRDAPLQTEAVEQRLLHHPPLARHRPNLLHSAEENQRPAPPIRRGFSTQSALRLLYLPRVRSRFV